MSRNHKTMLKECNRNYQKHKVNSYFQSNFYVRSWNRKKSTSFVPVSLQYFKKSKNISAVPNRLPLRSSKIKNFKNSVFEFSNLYLVTVRSVKTQNFLLNFLNKLVWVPKTQHQMYLIKGESSKWTINNAIYSKIEWLNFNPAIFKPENKNIFLPE